MQLGERLKAARLAKGLTQRELCGDTVTRNMLSQIENGTATPSMQTLTALVQRLGMPMSYFLDENTILSPNCAAIKRARAAMADDRELLPILEGYTAPDEVFDPEYRLLSWLGLLQAVRKALEKKQTVYARGLLERAAALEEEPPLRYFPELARRRVLLATRIDDAAAAELPDIDEDLLLRAAHTSDNLRKGILLDACENRNSSRWNLLRGACYTAAGEWNRGAECLHRAEAVYPAETAPLLEQCCRELGDYRGAYLYACRQRESEQ